MFFLYTPSIYGFASAFLFLILAIAAINEDSWLKASGWLALSFSYTIKNLPKFFILSFFNLFALILLIIGLLIILYVYSEEINFLRGLFS
ncbi:MAG: hypothetical protein CL748_00250 [Chloroflexi bacterium]|nr:hypothetical protein [Chloroflexota bacterium]|tara:strand:+ start:566 stop:835 length:270 start_codon:yes stop_codon:yes gene_type:complete